MKFKYNFKIIHVILSIGFAFSLAMIATGLTSPPELTSASSSGQPNTHVYIFIQHSGPYHLVIKLEGKWNLKVYFSSTPCGKYSEIWEGNGSYPKIVNVDFPSRGYVEFLTSSAGNLVLQRLRPALQYDYLYQGLLFFSVFGIGEIVIFLAKRI